jgi:PTH1 family peptidyl-tRNA hydrolase
MSDISMLFGLGNPGDRYRNTRHNLGSNALDLLASKHSLKWAKGDGPFLQSQWRLLGRAVILLKSLTYMNVSGCALELLPGVEPSELLVLCDDMSLPLGRLRIRERGGSGGHLGLESVIVSLDSEAFARMRLGIGALPPGLDGSEFVLMPFLDEEQEIVRNMLLTAVEAIETIVSKGVKQAMQLYNRRSAE